MQLRARQNKRSWKEDERQLKADLLPKWKNRAATAISRSDVREILDRIVARGSKVAANRVRALISRIYSFRLQWEIIDPPGRWRRQADGEKSRERVLTDDEIRRVWAACDTQNDWVAAWFRLRLVTAQRGGELLQMRWQDIDASGAWWTIPAEFVSAMKRWSRSRGSPHGRSDLHSISGA